MLLRHWHGFFNAWVFFSRLPAPPGVQFSDEYLNLGSRYFSWIGVVIGLILAGAFLLASQFWAPPVATAIILGLGLLLTGAFHEDGLADLFDGFGGAFTRDDAMRIMKDSRLGTYGSVALLTTFLLRWLALTALLEASVSAWLLLPFVHSWSRFWSISTLWSLPYVQSSDRSKSKPLATQFGPGATLTALIPPLILLFFLPLYQIAIVVGAALMVRAILVSWFRRRIQGYTGDCLGGAQQLQELTALLVLLALL